MPAFLQTARVISPVRLNRFVSTNLSARTKGALKFRNMTTMRTRILPPHVNERLSAETPALYIDVRSPKEYADGHVPKALNIPVTSAPGVVVPSFVDDVRAVSNGRTLILGCKSGKRSSMAIDLLEKAGFEHLVEMEGGFDAWLENTNLPVER